MPRQMKDSGYSWIGYIPSNWEVRAVKNYYSLQTGFTPDTKNEDYYDDNGRDWITISDLNGSKVIPNTTKSHISDLYLQNNNQPIVPKGSLLYSFKLSVGQVAFADRDVYTNEAIASFLNTDEVCLDYLYYSSSMIIENANENIYGAKILNQDLIRNAKIVFPPLEEQRRIASYLDSKCAYIDSVIEKTKESIEEYKKLKQAIITNAVTKGVRGERPMKDSGNELIGNIPMGWEIKRLKFIGDRFLKGNGITKDEVYPNGDTPCVRYGEIYSRYECAFDTCYSYTNCDVITNKQYFEYGDILFAGTGELVEEIGKSIVYVGKDKCLTGGDIILLKHSQNPIFLNYALNSYYAQTQKSCGKTKLKVVHISANNLANIVLALPPLAEQEEIAEYLNKKCEVINNIIVSKEEQIKAITLLKKSLIYEYVTGKKEVPVS